MTALDMNRKALAVRQATEAQRIWDSLEDERKSDCMKVITDYYKHKDESEKQRYATGTLQKYRGY